MRDPRYNLFIKYALAILLPMLAVTTLYVDFLMEDPHKERAQPAITAHIAPPPPEIIFINAPKVPKTAAKKNVKKAAVQKKAKSALFPKISEDQTILKYAEKTGVSARLIDAILTTETQRGKNIGKKNMFPRIPEDQKKPLKGICASLGYHPNKVPLAPKGEMGPAQFQPKTWRMFENKISNLTGHGCPNPWKFEDATAATALYLETLGAKEDENMAIQKYNAGSKWRTHGRPYLAKVLVAKRKSNL